ncbi:hypothetical protein [Actinoplanes sp. NPDC020271]|uniref:hypothetical protein n=1 Tax=Actinoplanes sp. NPDC020271 TaxID=3363896 RepID=UPI0037A3D499
MASAAIVAGAGLASPAQAAPKQTAGKVTRYDRATLRPAADVSGVLRRKMDTAKSDFVESHARRGRNVDSRTVDVYTDPAQSVIVAAGADEAVDGIDLGTVDGVHVAAGVRTHQTGVVTNPAASAVVGFAGAPTYSEYVQDGSGYHTVTATNDADIKIGGTVNFLESWYWKYVLPEAKEANSFGSAMRSGSDFYVYARRGIADAKSSGTSLVDLTIRSRPWGGTSGNLKKMLYSAPGGSATSCSEQGAIGVGYGPASVKIPRSNCASVTQVTSTGSAFEFGADWDGDTSDQIAIEAIASYQAVEGKVPSFADYIWATFDPGLLSSNKDVKWTDTGW